MRGNPKALAPWNSFKEPYVRDHKFGTPKYWAAVREASVAWRARKAGGVVAPVERSNPDDGASYVATEVIGSTAGTLLGLGIFFGAVAWACSKLKRPGYVPGNPYQQPPGCG